MQYEVQIIEDQDMPDGQDMLIVERGPADAAVMLLSGRPAAAFLAMRAYEDTLEPCTLPSVLKIATPLLLHAV